jgi:hypothetical protein
MRQERDVDHRGDRRPDSAMSGAPAKIDALGRQPPRSAGRAGARTAPAGVRHAPVIEHHDDLIQSGRPFTLTTKVTS